ncbi:hypothetical protein HMPREF3291_08625 [Bacillus sp. HMSC76G11]|nr:hypothetical protein HMPREF3291_08625 [Bacillus sp. HMSC76G11]
MIWKQMVKDLNLPNEEQVMNLLKRTPADPLIYILRVQDQVQVEASTYYKILIKKYAEEGNTNLFRVAREYEYILRDARERKKDW